MDYVRAINQLQTQCPLCGQQLKEPARFDGERDLYWITCVACKIYGITDEVFRFSVLDFVAKPALSGMVRRHFDLTHKSEVLTSTNCRDLASQSPDKTDVPSKVRYLLGYIAQKSHFPGERVVLNSETDYPVCFAANSEEFQFYVQYAREAGFADEKREDMRSEHSYWLTTKGWEEARRIPTIDSPYAFVAMSFTKDGPHGDLLTRAFDEAIRPAIEQDAGYHEVIRIDREEFLGDIVFEIIARIKECRFLVADATEHKNGVYFEAGYAMGMGLPVIWMCHKKDMDKAHFDTSHLNHIVWDDINGLRKSLANRVLAMIGRGPRKDQV